MGTRDPTRLMGFGPALDNGHQEISDQVWGVPVQSHANAVSVVRAIRLAGNNAGAASSPPGCSHYTTPKMIPS